jgi:photosystem II stability/assembly factor-like uncharacterized protein
MDSVSVEKTKNPAFPDGNPQDIKEGISNSNYVEGKKGISIMKQIRVCVMGVVLLVLSACNLASGGSSPTIDWESLRGTPTPETPVEQISTASAPTTTAAPEPTPTQTAAPTEEFPGLPRLEPGTEIDILQIEMADLQNGWGIGGLRGSGNRGRVFRTSDGGKSWREVTPPEPVDGAADGGSMSAIGYFADAVTGWVTYRALQPGAVPQAPVVWKTADGGRSWSAGEPLSTVDFAETYFVSHITFAGANDGWVLVHVGAGMNHDYIALYRTADGGGTWSRVVDPSADTTVQACTKTGMAFSDGMHGWLTGDCNGVRPGAFLYRSADGGTAWEPVELTPPDDQPGLFEDYRYACRVNAPFLAAGAAFFGVECDDMETGADDGIRYLYRTSAGGGFDGRPYPGGDLFTLDGSRIWALGKDIHRTEDGGGTWSKISAVTWDGQFDFVSATTGWAAVRKGNEYGLVRTDDGGVLWVQLATVVAAAE